MKSNIEELEDCVKQLVKTEFAHLPLELVLSILKAESSPNRASALHEVEKLIDIHTGGADR